MVARLWLLAALLAYLLRLSWAKRTDRLLTFAFWLILLAGCTAATRLFFLTGDIVRAGVAVHLAGFALLGLVGLASRGSLCR